MDSLTRADGFALVDYRHGPAAGRYDKALAMDPALVLGFIQATQPKVWHSLQATLADQLFFDQIQEEAIESDALQQAADTNSKEDFRYVFEKAFEGLVMDRMEGNEEIFGKRMADGGW